MPPSGDPYQETGGGIDSVLNELLRNRIVELSSEIAVVVVERVGHV